MIKKICISAFLALHCFYGVNAQVNVTVDSEEIRYLGDVSELDRSKFINLHSYKGSDPDILRFLSDYNAGFGRSFWGPHAFARSKSPAGTPPGTYPAYTPGTTDNSVRKVSRYVATSHPGDVMHYNTDVEAAANYAVEYWLDVANDGGRPEFWEPMNEPFVHAGDEIYKVDQEDQVLVRQRMADMFNGLAAKVKATPQLANMKMVGYSSAWPSMELWDFGHWTTRMKMFIDRAGANMDAISVHPYDGVNITGQNNRRSGSNSEAILDLIETYTAQKFGSPKNLAITEYGIIEQNYPPEYTDAESSISIRGINSMMMNFMEREDNIAITVPFIVDKAEWFLNGTRTKPYSPALWRPIDINKPKDQLEFIYSYKIHFYELWKDVKGMRTSIVSDNPDIQVQSFLDVTDHYIVLNNLDDFTQTINLNMISSSVGVSSVEIKNLKIYDQADPSYTVSNVSSIPDSLPIESGETIIMRISYGDVIVPNKKITRNKYYGAVTSATPGANAPAINISAGTNNIFEFSNVNVNANGRAMLRVGIGRPKTLTKVPNSIKVNGTEIAAIPNNWPGYDQATRDNFFGVVKVPFDHSLLNAGTNTVSVSYSDSGGQMSSLILEVENKDNNCATTWYEDADFDGLGNPAITQTSCAKPNGFVSNADDTDPANHVDGVKIFPVPGRVQAQDYNEQAGISIFAINDSETGEEFLGNIRNGDFSQYKVNIEKTGVYEVSFRVGSDGSQGGGGTINLYNKGQLLTTATVTDTGAWRTFETIVSAEIPLERGIQDIRLDYEGPQNLFALNWIEFKEVTLSVTDFSALELNVYPNPMNNTLTIDGLKEPRKINILDITGRVVKQLNLKNQTNIVNMFGFAPGVYYLMDIKTGSSHKLIKR